MTKVNELLNLFQDLKDCLKKEDFKNFEQVVKKIEKQGYFFDPREINERFEIISNLIIKKIKEVAENYQTASLGDIIEILKIANKYSLLEGEISESHFSKLKELKNDPVLMANLSDLFGKFTNSFLKYIRFDVPDLIYGFLIKNQNPYFFEKERLMHYVKNSFFNNYSIYGLFVRKIGNIDQFVSELKKKIESSKLKENKALNRRFLEVDIPSEFNHSYFWEDEKDFTIMKRHLIVPEYLYENVQNVLNKNNYSFYNLSMVLLGGIGPQGNGFTYSTPKGEVIEICSDQKESNAIIIKYKSFLKNKFLKELESELEKINVKIKEEIINFLQQNLNPKELIGYQKQDFIFKHVEKFFISEKTPLNNIKVKRLLLKIKEAIIKILRPIKMIDQFKARMMLVAEKKLKPEDIAKFTSLKEKSHYDILRERLFFQYIVDWMHEKFISEINS